MSYESLGAKLLEIPEKLKAIEGVNLQWIKEFINATRSYFETHHLFNASVENTVSSYINIFSE